MCVSAGHVGRSDRGTHLTLRCAEKGEEEVAVVITDHCLSPPRCKMRSKSLFQTSSELKRDRMRVGPGVAAKKVEAEGGSSGRNGGLRGNLKHTRGATREEGEGECPSVCGWGCGSAFSVVVDDLSG